VVIQKRRAAALYYGLQLANLAVPLLLVPFYGRILGAVGLGLLAQGQGLAAIVMIIVDYGFQLTAARGAAGNIADKDALGQLLADVMAAKLCLVSIVAGVSILLWLFLDLSHVQFEVFSFSLLLGILQGLSLYWFFGGRHLYVAAGLLDFLPRITAAALVLLIVRTERQVWTVQAIFAATAAVFLLAGFIFAQRDVPFRSWTFIGARKMLRVGRYIFFQAVVGTIYSTSNALLFGMVAEPGIVGIFSGAERLSRISFLPFTPFRQTLFPIVAAKVHEDPVGAWKAVRRMAIIATSTAAAIAVIVFIFAGPIVRLVLGPGFAQSVPLLRIMAVVPVFLAISESLGSLWLLPNFRDATMTRIVTVTGVCHISLMIILGSILGALGAAIALVAGQAIACLQVLWTSRAIPHGGLQERIYRS
jgi:polysaccharide transporter, PST family